MQKEGGLSPLLPGRVHTQRDPPPARRPRSVCWPSLGGVGFTSVEDYIATYRRRGHRPVTLKLHVKNFERAVARARSHAPEGYELDTLRPVPKGGRSVRAIPTAFESNRQRH